MNVLGKVFFLVPGVLLVLARIQAAAAPDELRMNQVQVIGTHNSYHVKPEGQEHVGNELAPFNYSHAPLDVQLDRGVRNLELDIYPDPAGTRVMHVPGIDEGSTCARFTQCLETVKEWSDKHPRHVPIILLVEPKNDEIPVLKIKMGNYNAAAIDLLDQEIRSVFAPERLITPDAVRGAAPTLRQAVEEQGWPLLESARGKVMLVFHTRGRLADLYTQGRPSLEGRAMFLESQPGKPYAAFFIRNNPFDTSIAELVKQGYMVRTRADSGLVEGVRNEVETREAALHCGAQIVSTDFPEGEAHPQTGYKVTLPHNMPARCNPVNGPADALETCLETPQQSVAGRP